MDETATLAALYAAHARLKQDPDPVPGGQPPDPPGDAPESAVTEVTVSYDHPDNEPRLGPVTYTCPVPVASLYRLIDLLDELAADAA